MLVQSDVHHVLLRVLDEYRPFLIIAILQELLAEVVAKRVSHELDHVLIRLKPDGADRIALTTLELLLQETATMLVFAKAVNLPADMLDVHVVVAGHG